MNHLYFADKRELLRNLENKKEHYSLITNKQKEARATIKQLQQDIKDLKANKISLSTYPVDLENKLKKIVIDTVNNNTSTSFSGNSIRNDIKEKLSQSI